MTESGLPTYHERLPQVSRRFQLHSDRVEIEARWTLGKRVQATVKLADLSPVSRTFLVRNKWLKHSVLACACGVGAALFLARTGLPWTAWIAWALAGAALLMVLRTLPRQRFVRFPRKDGRPGLDLCDTDAAAFGPFVRELEARIRKA